MKVSRKSIWERLISLLVTMGGADVVLCPEARDTDKLPSRAGDQSAAKAIEENDR